MEQICSKIRKYTEKYANNREVVMYGFHDIIQYALEADGCKITKIFTSDKDLLRKDSRKFIDFQELRGQEDKYYVIIPFLQEDGGKAVREAMCRFGYTKYRDYIFCLDDEDIDRTLTKIERYSRSREIVIFGYSKTVEEQLYENEILIDKRFSGNEKVIKSLTEKGINCQRSDELKGRKSDYYVINPFFLEDGGLWQRNFLARMGFKEEEDYCFFTQPGKAIDYRKIEYADKGLASRLYVPDQYKEIWYEPFSGKGLSDRKLKVETVENGIVLPIKYSAHGVMQGGVCDSGFRFLAGHLYGAERTCKGWVCDAYAVDDEEIEFREETVVYGGVMLDHPGHLIIDCFAQRIWWYLKNPESNYKCAVTAAWGNSNARFVKEFFELFGIPEDRIIFVTRPTKFKEIIIPEQSLYTHETCSGFGVTQEYRSVFEHIKKGLRPGIDKKIYFTKIKNKKQDIIGEEYFIEFYKERGYTIINPEEHSLREKAEILFGADEFAAQIGTNTLYSIFCHSCVKLVILSRINNSSVNLEAQKIINETAQIKDFYCVDISLNFLHKDFVWGVNLLGITDSFKAYVKDRYGEEIACTQEDSLRTYLYPYLKRFSEYYDSKFLFNGLKNQKMLPVLRNMSEVFLKREFNEDALDIVTTEDELSKKLTLSDSRIMFLNDVISDLIYGNRLLGFLYHYGGASISLMCSNDTVDGILEKLFDLLNIKVIYRSRQIKCRDLSPGEWDICKAADLILGYNDEDIDPGMREGIKAINVRDLLRKEHFLTMDRLPLHNVYIKKAGSKKAAEEIKENLDGLSRQISEFSRLLANQEKLQEEIKELNLLNSDLCKEKQQLMNDFNLRQLQFEHTQSLLEQEIEKLRLDNRALQSRKNALEKQVNDYSSSHSWRITKPLRFVSGFLHSLSGKS